MLTACNFCLAPWVIREDRILLGTKLKAIRVPHLNIPAIPVNQLDYLIQNNFVAEQSGQEKVINSIPLFLNEGAKMPNILFNWIWVPDSSFADSAFLLKKHLSSFGVWKITTDKDIILNHLRANPREKPFLIRLSHQEPIGNEVVKNIYADFMDKTQIVWVGETTEGMHLGPIIRNNEDLKKYHTATRTWHFSQQLIDAGFKEYWPSSLYLNLQSNPKKIADAILEVIQSPPETCFLVEENRKTCLWTTLTDNKVSESTFFDTQFWSKGLIRNFKMGHFSTLNEGYISQCRTPCKGIDYLEGNSGKGVTETSALYSLVGESIERFSAWQSNQKIAKPDKPCIIKNKKDYYDISQFHPFGSKWEHYLTIPKKELPLWEVKDETHPKRICFVPECLIPFPYTAPDPQYDVTTSATAGLAVHSNYEKAVINGALELFERDDLYTSFLLQKTGFALDFSKISDQLDATRHFTALLTRLKSNQLDYWCIVYSLKPKFPLVHFFIHDKGNHFFSRGSGSGYTLLEAIERSVAEALQIRQQFLNTNSSGASQAYENWRKPEVIEQIRGYLKRFYKLPFLEHPLHAIEYTPDLLLKEIKKNLKIQKKPLLVADLPCAIEKWFSVRVLIPGFTTHQYASESEGGKKIMMSIFKNGIPT